MAKLIQNDYRLDDRHLTPEEIRKAVSGDLDGFKFFFEHCLQIQDRDTRQLIHPKMNKGQEMIAEAILRHVSLDTRADSHRELVLCGPRQFGKSTLLTAIAHYIVSYVRGMERSNLVHTLHTGGAASKFCSQKVIPIVAGCHPDLFPTIERESLNTSTQLKYKDLKGRIRRDSIYEVLSASSNSVRSGTVTAWLCDEPSEYRNPEMVEDAISGAISSYGFSFTAYIGTFSDRISHYFLSKIQLALEHPDEMELVFVPWFFVYGREGDGLGFSTEDFTEYDREVIVPEMKKFGYSDKEILDKIGWYHQRALRTSHMRFEFPTCIEDIMALATDQAFFSEESLKKQEPNIEHDKYYRLVTDNLTGKVEAQKVESSSLQIFRSPIYGRRYRITIDPITAMSDGSDYYAMHVMDVKDHEQVAVFHEKGLTDADYADCAVSLGKIYNNAELCPEINVSSGFVAEVNNRHYYRWFYANAKARSNKEIGIRTSISNRNHMLDVLYTLFEREIIKIHDEETLNELRNFIKKVVVRSDGSKVIKAQARGKAHDDLVMALAIFAESLDQRDIEQRKKVGWSVAW